MMLITPLMPVLLMGQTSVGPVSSLSGIVYDQQRATIPRAEIRITCGADRRVLAASEMGRFAAAALPGGPCTIVAAAPLFEPETIRLTLSGADDVAIVLRVRAVETEVTVSAHRGVLQKRNSVTSAKGIPWLPPLGGRAGTSG